MEPIESPGSNYKPIQIINFPVHTNPQVLRDYGKYMIENWKCDSYEIRNYNDGTYRLLFLSEGVNNGIQKAISSS